MLVTGGVQGRSDRPVEYSSRRRWYHVRRHLHYLLVAFGAGVDMAALGVKVDPDTKANMLANVPQGGLVLLMLAGVSLYVARYSLV